MIAIGLAITIPNPALAHTRVEAGPYVIIVGWQEEPVIVGERNAVWLLSQKGNSRFPKI
ncbi:MAG: hypothetical protein HC806_02355 [Anaerolineae bacterium]|nr:hypothetical protein [Anaerolineae bacterium]